MNGRPTPLALAARWWDCNECRSTGRTGADGEFPCDPCGGTGRVPAVPVQAYDGDGGRFVEASFA